MQQIALWQLSLHPLLFIIVMDASSEHVRREVPWDMLYTDDLIVADKEEAGLQARFSYIQDNAKTGTDVWSRGLDSDKKRRATGENRNENAAVDTWESH